MMEARKRGGTSRESVGDYDIETNQGVGAVDMASASPYSRMAKDPVEVVGGAPDGILAPGPSPAEDSHIRSLAKGFTWRFVASGTTIAIAKIVTGETTIAFQIGFIEFFAKIMIYYLHERIWAKIRL